MSNHTLYLIQSNYAVTAKILEQLAQIYTPGDQIVLMGEAVLQLEHSFLQNLPQIYMLENDAELLTQPLPDQVKLLDFADFADLCLGFNRCISMK
ncbi:MULTISPECIES: DsrH/TusB family sulfur metabolism protein [unclassified Acinetobacter]|uniref:DsrH/TusB family sulfur metabolism protein n=1 Tax=unclassified Acinetobacter TaxID=196816 RepID=UPI0015D2DBCA|nr:MULTISPECIES: DsrH/TusB family sulfur metabolism protein [unclassified Acinetobacter]